MNLKYLNKLEYYKILDRLKNYCITTFAKDCFDHLLPSSNQAVLEHWLEQTSEAITLCTKYGSAPICPLLNLLPILKSLESTSSLSPKFLLEIAKVLKVSSDLKNYFYQEEKYSSYPKLEEFFSSLYTSPSVLSKITDTILDDETISSYASTTLHSIRKKQHILEETIRNKLNSFIHSSNYSKYIQDAIVTIRNDRYVIPVKNEYRNMVKGFIHDISSSGSTVFIEPTIIFELNNDITHLKLEENMEIERILANLSSMLIPFTNELALDYELIGNLDFIFAKAKFSLEYDCIIPIFNTEKVVNLIQARHPFIPKESVVPIDITIGSDFSTLVITGPNTGGKTVTLKTLGLLCCMASSGIPIPAKQNSSVYAFDSIFADIGDEQSIQESLSTFSAHISNIIEILQVSTSNSLVLLDELGSGTDPIEGASLAISILEHFFENRTITLATTHYPEIKNYALIHSGFKNASCEFDIENLRPTYKLLVGIPGKSNAFAISQKLGLPDKIIQRASSLLTQSDVSIEELLKKIYDDKILIEKEKETLQKNSNQIELLRKNLEKQNADLEQKRSILIDKAKTEARNILLTAKEQVNVAMKKVDSASVKELNHIRNELNDSIKNTVCVSPDTSSTTPTASLSVEQVWIGMPVWIKSLNQNGIILSLPNRAKQVQVQIGSAKMSLPLDALAILNPKEAVINKTTSKVSTNTQAKSKNVDTEINVIGYHVEEAIYVIDKYLDDVALAKLPSVRIVHGKGTGALRNGIHAFLKKHSHVQSYRLGTFGEGEMGVTIVEIKY